MNMHPFSLKRKYQSPCDKKIVQFMWERCVPKKFYKYIYRKNLFVHLILEVVSRRCSVRKVFLKFFSNFTGKHLCQSPFFQSCRPQVLSCEFCKTPPVDGFCTNSLDKGGKNSHSLPDEFRNF